MSWSIALAEYGFQVPANRIGHHFLAVTQLKVLQEVITLTVFTLIAFPALPRAPNANMLIAYVLLVLAVFFAFRQPV